MHENLSNNFYHTYSRLKRKKNAASAMRRTFFQKVGADDAYFEAGEMMRLIT